MKTKQKLKRLLKESRAEADSLEADRNAAEGRLTALHSQHARNDAVKDGIIASLRAQLDAPIQVTEAMGNVGWTLYMRCLKQLQPTYPEAFAKGIQAALEARPKTPPSP